MLALSLIKILLKREEYNKYYSNINNINKNNIEKEISNIISIISKYYLDYPNHNFISCSELQCYFYSNYPSLRTNPIYLDLFSKLSQLDISDSVASKVMEQFLERDAAVEILGLITPIISGDSYNGVLQIPDVINRYKTSLHKVDIEESFYIDDDPEQFMGLFDKSSGLHWGLRCLNENLRPLPGGTLGHIFARVEAGKTSFITSQVSAFVSQLKEKEDILWVCNEEHGSFVKARTFQSILNMSSSELAQITTIKGSEELRRMYREATRNKINVFYKADCGIEDIRSQLERRESTRILIVDIADHISFRGMEDLSRPQRLGELYRKFRLMASQYNIDIITAGQASAEADGRKDLRMDMMHDSKTDKPGALDYALGLGKTYNDSETELRWITICKNKIGITRQEVNCVRIDKERGRFYDV